MALLLRWTPLVAVAAVAFFLRTHELARRPMHADEANQAVKTGQLLETGRYAFDPSDHHGPTLYYAALPIAWLRGERTLAALSESTVRLVPALFGTAAVALLYFLALPLGRWSASAAAAFFALSPPAVYYSRFFIQETLLLTFTLAAFACAQRWWSTRRLGWAIATGVAVGFMQATKITAPLFLASAAIALAVVRALTHPKTSRASQSGLKSALPQALAACVAALATAALLYSSFLTHPRGLIDAFSTYAHTFNRLGTDTGHEKPWWYYLRLFGWQREGGLVSHQLPFAAAALGGLIFTSVQRSLPLLRAAAIYTLLLGAVLALTAYKTPWHAIHLLPGLAILAGAFIAAIARLPTGKYVAVPAALLIALSLLQQSSLAAFRRPADARNPYAYVHSSPDVVKFLRLAETANAQHPDLPIRVISEEYWPLPWYLRGAANVGYWSAPPENCDGALVITSPTHLDSVRARLHGEYQESILGLRPGVLLVVFTPVEKSTREPR